MKNSRLLRLMTIFTFMVIFIGTFTTGAFAYVNGADMDTLTPPAVTERPEQAPEPEPTANPVPLTPDGNLTLVDDVSGEEATDKQFITVISKSGNYFYLVIDRAGDTENVYFLNLVDEADLMALIEDATPTQTTQPAVEEMPTEQVEPEPAPEPEKKDGIGGILVVILIIALIGGGAFFYFKVLKPKRQAGGGNAIEFDEFDFDDEDEDEYAPDDEIYRSEDDNAGAYEEISFGADNTESIGDEPETEDRQ